MYNNRAATQELGLLQPKEPLLGNQKASRKPRAPRCKYDGPVRRSARTTAPQNYNENLLAGIPSDSKLLPTRNVADPDVSRGTTDAIDDRSNAMRIIRVQVSNCPGSVRAYRTPGVKLAPRLCATFLTSINILLCSPPLMRMFKQGGRVYDSEFGVTCHW